MKSLIKVLYISVVSFFFMSCEKENEVTPFYLETTSAQVSGSTVALTGKSNYMGTVTKRGFCISTSPQPTVSDKVYVVDKFTVRNYYDNSYFHYDRSHYFYDNHNSDYIGNDEITTFKKSISLEPGKYYVRAYARSNESIVYGNEKTFTIK